MKIEKAKLIKKEQLSEHIFAFDLKARTIARNAKPGQFIQVRVNESFDPFLRRPLSFASVKEDTFRIVFRVRGKGTKILSEYSVGEYLDVLGPLGKLIKIDGNQEMVLIGGGVGIAPLYFLAQEAAKKKNQLKIFLGAKNREELIMLKDFKRLTKDIAVATEDGSLGKKGKVTDLLTNKSINQRSSKLQIFVCGPTPMLKIIQKKFTEIPIYGFLEERMGCGTGICFCCAVKRKSGEYLRVCQEGPVVNLNDIEL